MLIHLPLKFMNEKHKMKFSIQENTAKQVVLFLCMYKTHISYK